MYAKIDLLMFYPYQKLNNLTVDGSYWKKIIKNCNAIFSKKHKILGKVFWNTSKYRRLVNPTKTCQTCWRPNFGGNHSWKARWSQQKPNRFLKYWSSSRHTWNGLTIKVSILQHLFQNQKKNILTIFGNHTFPVRGSLLKNNQTKACRSLVPCALLPMTSPLNHTHHNKLWLSASHPVAAIQSRSENYLAAPLHRYSSPHHLSRPKPPLATIQLTLIQNKRGQRPNHPINFI